MIFSQYTQKTQGEVYDECKVTRDMGLSSETALRLLKTYGYNVMGESTHGMWHIFARQFRSPFVYLLAGAGVVTLFLREIVDTVMIVVFVLIDTFLGWYQEFRSEQTLQILKKYTRTRAKIIRDGKEQIQESALVVPGDIIIYEAGDVISADTRLLECYYFSVNESVLTGESVSVGKTADASAQEALTIFEAKNIVFSGTTVATGRAVGVVIATGRRCVIGEIRRMVSDTKRPSSFEKNIRRFSSFILRMVGVTLALVLAANIFVKRDTVDVPALFVFSVALAVSVIPEALPVVTTFSLSRGAKRLAHNKVVVKRLSSIEDLGAIDILCTDKTGTLTENVQTLESIHSSDKRTTLLYALLASSTPIISKKESNNAFDVALWKARGEITDATIREYETISEIPFDPERKRNGVLVKHKATHIFILRGAPEEILALSNLSESELHALNRLAIDEGNRGKRVIAVAYKVLPNFTNSDPLEEEQGMRFLGMLSFADPLKKTAKEAVSKAGSLGVTIKILTGDSPEVAGAVAQEIGLIHSLEEVITGKAFERMSSRNQHTAVERYAVFARMTPQEKHKIIQLLQERHEVGFLGEGINDAPALKTANVGLVVSDASDVAREAADIILLKKSLHVIVDGIGEGRSVFANTVKYIQATLASNFGNFYAVSIASLMIDFLPMLPVQILLVNLLSDFPMIAVSTDTVEKGDIKNPQRYNLREIAFVATVLGLVSTVFDFIFFALYFSAGPEVLQTNWFMASIFTELIFLFSIRTKMFVFRSKRPSAPLIILTLLAFSVTLVLPFTSFGRNVFHFVLPQATHMVIMLILLVCFFAVTESAKLLCYHNFFKMFSPARNKP